MTASDGSGSRVRFGPFEADLRSGELFKEGQRIPLPNQSFLALTALLEQAGQVISRETLRARLWPDKRVVEFDQGLNATINRLREALGDSAVAPKFIETLPRRGYRFVAVVEVLPSPTVPSPTVPSPGSGAVAAPGERPPSASAEEYEATTAAGLDGPLAPRGTRRSRTGHLYLALITLAALTGVVLMRLPRIDPNDDGTFSRVRVHPLTSLVGREIAPTFSPDGTRFAFGWNAGGPVDEAPEDRRFGLYVKSVDSERTLQLTRRDAISIAASWSRDGRQLAFARTTDEGSGIYQVPSTGGAETLLEPALFLNEDFMQSSWSPDDRLLAYAAIDSGGRSAIHLLTLAASESRALQRPPSCSDAGQPTFAPDGHQLAYVCTSSLAVYDIIVTELPSGAPRRLASLQGYPKGLAWSSSGDALTVVNDAADGSALWRVSLNGQLSRMPSTEEALGPGIALSGDRAAFVREKHSIDIWRVDLTEPTAAGQALIASTRMQLVPQYSPDGAHIAFQSTRSGSSEIWVADADGDAPAKVTSFEGPLTGAPSWCSDSRRIAFDSRASGASAIYIVDILEGRPHRLETSAINLAVPVWSTDCQWIFASDGRLELYRVPATGGTAERFTAKPAYRAVVSGPQVIFNVVAPSGVELWTKPADGGTESPLQDLPLLGYADSWTATRDGIYFVQGATRATVSFYEFASRRIHVVRSLSGAPAPLGGLGIAVSEDQRWLLYTRSVTWEGDVMLMSGLP